MKVVGVSGNGKIDYRVVQELQILKIRRKWEKFLLQVRKMGGRKRVGLVGGGG